MTDTIQLDVHRISNLQEEAQIPVLIVKTVSEYPELMTKEELIDYLRIPKVSRATDFSNSVENLRRMRGLPYIHLCGQPLYPKKGIDGWIEENTEGGL